MTKNAYNSHKKNSLFITIGIMLIILSLPLGIILANSQQSVNSYAAMHSMLPVAGSGIIIEPVLVPYCQITGGGGACSEIKGQFHYPYQVTIYRELGGLSNLVFTGNYVGPLDETIPLGPGTYVVHFTAGQLATRYPSAVTVSTGQYSGPQLLYFAVPPSITDGMFKDYNGCVYSLSNTSAAPTICTKQ
jgi:hypothetical protein